MPENLSHLLRGVAQYINCTITAIPTLEAQNLTKIRHMLETQQTPKSAEIICTSLTVYARKPENAQLIATDPLLDALLDLCSKPTVASGPASSFFLKLLLALIDVPEIRSEILSRRMANFFELVFRSGSDASIIILSQILTRMVSSKYFIQLVESSPEIFIAAAQTLRPEAYQACAFLHSACSNKTMRSTLVQNGLCESIIKLFEGAPGLLGDAPVLVTFTFACSDPVSASRVLETKYLTDSLPIVLDAAINGEIGPDITSLHVRAVNLLCSSPYYKEKNINIKEYEKLISSLEQFTEVVKKGKTTLTHSLVELIYSLTWNQTICEMCLEKGILEAVYEVCIRIKEKRLKEEEDDDDNDAEDIDLLRYLNPLRNRFLVLMNRKNLLKEGSPFLQVVLKSVEIEKDDISAWRFLLFMILVSPIILEPKLEEILGNSLEHVDEKSTLLSLTIKTCILSFSFRNKGKTSKVISKIPSEFIEAFLVQARKYRQLEKEFEIDDMKGSNFSFTSSIPDEDGTNSIFNIIQHLAPYSLLSSICICITMYPTSRDKEIVNSILRYWVGNKDLLLPFEFGLLRTISKALSVEEIFGNIDIKYLLSMIENTLGHRLEGKTLITCCSIISTILGVKSNKSLVAVEPIILRLKIQLERNKNDEASCSALMKILWVIATDPNGKEIMTEAGILDGVIQVIKVHKRNEAILQHALKTLWSLIMRIDNREKALKLGCISLLSEILSKYDVTHLSVMNSTLTCIKIFTQETDESCGSMIVESHALDKITRAMLGEDAKVARTAAQTIYACFVFNAVRDKTDRIYGEIGECVKKSLDSAVRGGEDLILMLKLTRIFASVQLTAEKVIKDGLLNSAIDVDTHSRKTGIETTELQLQIVAKVIKYPSIIRLIDSEKLLSLIMRSNKVLSRNGDEGIANETLLSIELLIKIVYACVSLGIFSKNDVRGGKLDSQLVELARALKDNELKLLAKAVHEGKTACKDEVKFPRSSSRTDF